jgi:hypothetical protein
MYSWQHCGTGTLNYRQPRHLVIMDQWNGRHKNVLHVLISSVFVGFFKSSVFFGVTLYKDNHANVIAKKLENPHRGIQNTSSICLLLTQFGRVSARQNVCTCYLPSSRLQIDQTSSDTPPPPPPQIGGVPGLFPGGKESGALTIRLHPAPRFILSVVMPLLSQP